jgi:hypothetical protein
MLTVTTSVRFTRGRSGRKRLDTSPPPAAVPAGRVPRVARLMALAIRFDAVLRDGVVADQSELARLARVTQPRMTQILNLLHLAPDLQEALLFLPTVVRGKDSVHERMLRGVCAEVDWEVQRVRWRRFSL